MIHSVRSDDASAAPCIRGGLLALLVIVASAAVAADGASESGRMMLSLDRALAIARADNPGIAIDRARRARADGARVRSRQAFSPRISFDATHLRREIQQRGFKFVGRGSAHASRRAAQAHLAQRLQ